MPSAARSSSSTTSSAAAAERARTELEANHAALAARLAGESAHRPRRSASTREVSYAPECDANGEPILTKEQKVRKKQKEKEKKGREKQKAREAKEREKNAANGAAEAEASGSGAAEKETDQQQRQEQQQQQQRDQSGSAPPTRGAKRVIPIDSDDELEAPAPGAADKAASPTSGPSSPQLSSRVRTSSTTRPAQRNGTDVLQPKRQKTFNLLSSSPEPRTSGASGAPAAPAPAPAAAPAARKSTLPVVELDAGGASPARHGSPSPPHEGEAAGSSAKGRGMRKRKSVDKDSWTSPAKEAAANAAAIMASRRIDESESPVAASRKKRALVVESDAEADAEEVDLQQKEKEALDDLPRNGKAGASKKKKTPSPSKRKASPAKSAPASKKRAGAKGKRIVDSDEEESEHEEEQEAGEKEGGVDKTTAVPEAEKVSSSVHKLSTSKC